MSGFLVVLSLLASGAAVAGGAPEEEAPIVAAAQVRDHDTLEDALDDDPDRWLTDGLRKRLLDKEKVPIDDIPGFPYSSAWFSASEDCDLECPALPYTMIRPGAALGLTQFACTANFVFQSGAHLGIGTAGHCTSPGDRHSTLVVTGGELGFVEFGETIFSTGNGGVGNDFALILIDPMLHGQVESAVSVVDGPCGHRGPNGSLEPIQYYGHAFGWGVGGQPRSGSVMSDSGSYLQYTRFHSGGGGDSGSPVVFVADGSGMRQAAAVHTHGLTIGVGLPIGLGTSMPRVFEILDSAGLDDWELVDSPNCL